MDDPWDDVAAAGEWLLKLEVELAPALIHLNGYAHAALPWRAPTVVVGHSCLVSWDAAIPGAIDRSKIERYRAAVTRGVRAAGWVVAPTAAMLQSLQTHYGPLANASRVPNGRSSDGFRPQRKEPFVFTAGRVWDPAKNIATVTSIAPQLPWPVALAGTADAESHGGAARLPGVRCLGHLSETALAQWLGRASIFALPARYEPFGLLPLEAALSGCALVLGDIPSLREVWADAAEYVDPGSAGAVRDAIKRLIAAPRLLQARGAAAREHALAYTPATMAAAYMSAYECLTSGAGHERRSMRCAS
jgi:glycosyltransferase involved in cell wall biosynthesis